ncbi:MAG: hypothetical protein MI810_01985 [Flavobacteriales bacterium]|jgi:hypothetical protein|nr:hypothetical protein [Flavobacteriales bacterium]
MKLKTIFTALTFIAFTQISLAQNVKIKKDIAYVDGVEYVKVEKQAGNMSIYGLDGEEELIYIKFYDPTPSNKENHDSYYIVRFLDHGLEAEFSGMTRKGVLKKLYNGKVIKDNKIDEEKMKKFVTKYGTDESKNKIYING